MTFDSDRRHDEPDDRGAAQTGHESEPEETDGPENERDPEGYPRPGGADPPLRDGDEAGGDHTKQSDF